MTRARSVSKLGNPNVFTVDTSNNVGVNSTVPTERLNVVGVVSATSFFGDGSNLSGITGGATLGAASGSQRVVVTSLTSGTMTDAGTDADLAWNSTTNTLSATNINVSGTLTYEDVTNVDSVGVVTARSGLRVVGGGATITGVTTSLSGVNIVGGGLTVTGVSTFFSDVSIADKIVHTGDTNTAIRFPAADVFSVETGGTERGRFESGVFLVGLQGENRNFGDEIAAFKGNRTGAGNPGTISLIKDGSSPTGDIGLIHFGASDDHDGYYASIRASSDGSTGGADLPGRLTFETTADGAASPTERLRIASAGQIGLGGANYGTSGQALISNGSGSAPTWQDVSVGLTTEALVSSGIVTTLNLTAAQDHKVTASGITTITVSGGTEADSHTVRIINSGITTVGFSTYFLFPSGSTPSLPTADGAISLISFTVNRVGAGGTQLLAGASVNYS